MKNKLISLILVCAMIMALAACTSTPKPSPAASDTGSSTTNAPEVTVPTEQENITDTLTIAITKDENSLTPFTYVSSTGTIVNSLIYDALFIADLNNDIVPWMVEEDYSVSDDYRSYTFTLRDGLKFHDGSPVTTADIEFSYTYPAGQNSASQRKICGQVESFDITDDKTMTINLADPDLTFLRTGLATLYIISKAQYENVEDATTFHDTMGSGMYALSEYKVGEYYVLTAQEDYFRGTPQVRTINMPIMTDSSAIQSSLLSGVLDASTSGIGIEMLETFEAASDITVYANPGFGPMLMNINNTIAPLDSVEFRTALTYAIDVEGIMKTLYGNYATIGTKGMIRPDTEYAVSGLEYVYDTAKANTILDDAGFDQKDSSGLRLAPDGSVCEFHILCYTGSTARIRAAELMVEQLKEVGIKMNVVTMEMDTVDAYVWPDFDVSKGRDYDFSMWGWGTSISPSFLVNMFSSDFAVGTFNVCGYVNAEVDAVITEKYNTAKTEAELYDALREIQEIAAEDPGLICFGFSDSLQACSLARYEGWTTGLGKNIINKYTFLA